MSTPPKNDLVTLTDRGPAAGDQVRAQLAPRVGRTIEKLLDLAEAGDPRSIELVLKYWAPPAKPDAERIEVAGLRDAPTIREKSLCILYAVSRGDISVDAGEKVQRMLELHTKAVTVDDLAAEMAQMKQQLKRQGRAPLLRVDNEPAGPTDDLSEFA